MAFDTLRGEAAVDYVGSDVDVAFKGSEGVDVLFSLNEDGKIYVFGDKGNDSITVADSLNTVGGGIGETITIRGGEGNDTISATNEGGVDARFANADVKGGKGEDTIVSAGAVSSKIRGNEDDDDFTLSSNYTATTVNGNDGQDSFRLAAGATISLQSAKILGGKGDDGLMNFTNVGVATGIITAAVASTINGGKGVDRITLDQITTASDFFVYGGQDGDVITSGNNGANGITYSGDKGQDQITLTGTANAVVNGGDDGDTLNVGASTGDHTIDGGAGNDTITLGAGKNSAVGGEGNDTFTDVAGDDTITGGGGADTFTTNAANENRYLYTAVSDSAPSTGADTVQGFDTFDAITAANNDIDITAIGSVIAGNAITSPATNALNNGGLATDAANQEVVLTAPAGLTGLANIDTWSAFATAVNAAGLTASTGNGQIQANTITVDAASAIGASTEYVILNNGNTILDAGDLIFEVAAGDQANVVAAINLGFDV